MKQAHTLSYDLRLAINVTCQGRAFLIQLTDVVRRRCQNEFNRAVRQTPHEFHVVLTSHYGTRTLSCIGFLIELRCSGREHPKLVCDRRLWLHTGSCHGALSSTGLRPASCPDDVVSQNDRTMALVHLSLVSLPCFYFCGLLIPRPGNLLLLPNQRHL